MSTETKTETKKLSRAAISKLLRETVRALEYAFCNFHDLSDDLWRLRETIEQHEKDHNKLCPSWATPKPFRDCVNYFILCNIAEALQTIGNRKTIPVKALNQRSDRLFAFKLVANIRNREHWGSGTILSNDLKRQIGRCAASTDYCDL